MVGANSKKSRECSTPDEAAWFSLCIWSVVTTLVANYSRLILILSYRLWRHRAKFVQWLLLGTCMEIETYKQMQNGRFRNSSKTGDVPHAVVFSLDWLLLVCSNALQDRLMESALRLQQLYWTWARRYGMWWLLVLPNPSETSQRYIFITFVIFPVFGQSRGPYLLR